MATTETWVLDGVALTSGNFDILELNADPPKSRPDWITAADSESAALMRQPFYENRTITMKLRTAAQASMNAALDQVGAIRDKLRKASATSDGIALVWTPANSTRTVTFDVLAGDIPELPIGLADHAWSWFKQRPVFTIELTAKPYWRGTETLTSTASSSTPITTMEVTGVTGDVPATGRLLVIDTATQDRRHVEWGIESQDYDNTTALILDSDSLSTSGFTGTGTTRTGAYDPNATGNNVIRATVTGQPVAICGTGNQAHVGVFRVWARVFVGRDTQRVRLSWRAGDQPYTNNPWAAPPGVNARMGSPALDYWAEIDLGLITVPDAIAGTQQWDGRVEAYETTRDAAPLTLDVDYLTLTPAAEGYGVAGSPYRRLPGVTVARDDMTFTAATALNARVAPLGGTWATSGSTTDFVNAGGTSVFRNTNSDSGNGRFAILGATNYTDVDVSCRVSQGPLMAIATTAFGVSLIARYVDVNNHLMLTYWPGTNGGTLGIVLRIAGVLTFLRDVPVPPVGSVYLNMALVAHSSGLIFGWLSTDDGATISSVNALHATTATGGTLATGKPGLLDFNSGVTSIGVVRAYDNFYVATPPTPSLALYSGRQLHVRYDNTIRQNSAGTVYGRPGSYRGSRFLVPPGTSRVAVRARRFEPTANAIDNVTDATQIQIGWTPRGLVVPR